ncbi:unnamed protein product [Prorocentrum cordatum]|uniref:Uncharacterized protein n=1 Tax=Prorocentrum cordatum TaxID=2364126 RepID=A0ABN9QII2_9DINO|nr:unnamed protein product [Polarella glacialis]
MLIRGRPRLSSLPSGATTPVREWVQNPLRCHLAGAHATGRTEGKVIKAPDPACPLRGWPRLGSLLFPGGCVEARGGAGPTPMPPCGWRRPHGAASEEAARLPRRQGGFPQKPAQLLSILLRSFQGSLSSPSACQGAPFPPSQMAAPIAPAPLLTLTNLVGP